MWTIVPNPNLYCLKEWYISMHFSAFLVIILRSTVYPLHNLQSKFYQRPKKYVWEEGSPPSLSFSTASTKLWDSRADKPPQWPHCLLHMVMWAETQFAQCTVVSFHMLCLHVVFVCAYACLGFISWIQLLCKVLFGHDVLVNSQVMGEAENAIRGTCHLMCPEAEIKEYVIIYYEICVVNIFCQLICSNLFFIILYEETKAKRRKADNKGWRTKVLDWLKIRKLKYSFINNVNKLSPSSLTLSSFFTLLVILIVI